MNALNRKAIAGIVRMFIILLAAIFLPVWTFYYWQGWACLAAFFIPAIAISVYIAKNDPVLYEHRVNAGASAEKEKGQKVVQTVTGIVFIADFVLPAFDHRFGWSSVSDFTAIAADALIVLSFIFILVVFRANRFTSGTIELMDDHKVISTGPYAVVRHPMYVGGLIMLCSIPVALGSWWGLLVNVPMLAAIVWRLLDEENFLVGKLPGYAEYCDRVKYRLVPWIW